MPDIVGQDVAYQNAMRYADAQNARDESDRALLEAILGTMLSGMELYSAFHEDKRNTNNQSFKKWLQDMVFNATDRPGGETEKTMGNISAYEIPETPVAMVTEPPAQYGANKLDGTSDNLNSNSKSDE